MDYLKIAAPKLANQTASAVVSWCSISAAPPRISFNAEYGYIESYDLGNCPKWEIGGGLMCPALADCNAGMMVRDLKFLPPS